jgi:hypothetical protein
MVELNLYSYTASSYRQGQIYVSVSGALANPSNGENPADKSWPFKLGVGHGASNPIPKKQILL